MMRVLSGSLLAAVLMFLFGFAFWGFSGLPDTVMAGASDEDRARTELSTLFPVDGRYQVPYSTDWEDESFRDKVREGPLVSVTIRHAGKDPDDFLGMLVGLVYQFACILMIAILLKMATGGHGGAMQSYGKRVGFVLLAGVAIATYSNFGNVVWWNHPVDYPALTALYDTAAWLVAALVLAAVIKPARSL